jgi:Flp pilus assembly pilin Flp
MRRNQPRACAAGFIFPIGERSQALIAGCRWRKGLDGQGLVEYSLILLFVVIAVIASVSLIGPPLIGFVQQAVGAFPT